VLSALHKNAWMPFEKGEGGYIPVHEPLTPAVVRNHLLGSCTVGVARAIVAAKVTHQRQLLLRAQRRLRDDPLADALGRMRLLAEQASRETDLDRLRGLEGMAAALYFGQFAKLLRPPDLTFAGRSRRPPRDPVNACLSFGYALLGNLIETDLLRRGMEPLVGFFHQPHHGRPSLALDLLEAFRPHIDALVLRLVNRRQLGPLDFEQRGGQSWRKSWRRRRRSSPARKGRPLLAPPHLAPNWRGPAPASTWRTPVGEFF
jgi:CRISP-associated protein Cas1